MIVIKIVGGLGNQLFQYATAISIARKFQKEIRLDIYAFQNPKYMEHEGFLLNHVYGIDTPIVSEKELFNIIGMLYPLRKKAHRLNTKLFLKNFIFENNPYEFKVNLVNKYKNRIYLDGMWQSYKYFDNEIDYLRKIYKPKEEYLSNNVKLIIKKFKNENSVSIHVRRGDYITNAEYNKIFNVVYEEYYDEAIKIIKNKIENPIFYIFTNDVEWVKNNKLFNNMKIMSIKESYSWVDMYLMQNCRHNIIANSTFSWWSAFLNNNIEKIVISPKYWTSKKEELDLLLPDEWIKINNV
jgi:hypothetical protein